MAAPQQMPPIAVAPAVPMQPVAAPHKPLVDETDWRVTRPAIRPAVRATEPVARPVAMRSAAAAAESRSPNLFQRITGAFAAPKGLTPVVGTAAATAAAPVVIPEPVPAPRPISESVAAVAAKVTPRPAPVQTSISLDPADRAKPARDDDDLQIPAFLRRQAN
jgi:cell division protein FtsZ